jgi:hypothetical protein
MIKIERDFEALADKWFELLRNKDKQNGKTIFDRVEEHFTKCNSAKKYFLDRENIEAIIICKPEEIIQLSIQLKCKFPDIFKKNEKEKSPIEKVFDYKFFIEKFGYQLSKSLNINVCPYCNRNFTNTIFTKNGENIIRPDFDHFFSQKDHPILALSFYNLIPSCQICNSRLKHDIPFDLKNYFHPYIDGFGDEVSFNYHPKSAVGVYGVQNSYSIFFEEKTGKEAIKKKVAGSKAVFKYEEIYNEHSDVLEELVAKIYKGSQTYLDSLKETFPTLNLTDAEMYRLAYGNYMNTADFEKRPFAKMTKDIFDKLGPDLEL